jgi:hypothetical protein
MHPKLRAVPGTIDPKPPPKLCLVLVCDRGKTHAVMIFKIIASQSYRVRLLGARYNGNPCSGQLYNGTSHP